ncbi:MAG: pullulanase-associated domain-containing protein, partial [Planctomycetota bacterium]
MFLISRLTCIVGLFVVLATPAWAEPRQPEAPEQVSVADVLDPADFDAEQLLVLHYHRPDGNYDGWNLWAWPDGGDGGSYPFDQVTEYGRYAVVPFDEIGRAGFIVRLREWEAKDVGNDRFVDLNGDGVTELFLVAGDPKVYGEAGEVDLTLRITAAFLDDLDRISLATTAALDAEQIDGLSVEGYGVREVVQTDRSATAGLVYDIVLDGEVAAADLDNLSVTVPGSDPLIVLARNALDHFAAPDAKLGSRHEPTATTFRVWSPVSESVNLLLYDKADGGFRTLPMEQVDNVWTLRVPGDHHGKQYRYQYTRYGETVAGPDINAYAATADS